MFKELISLAIILSFVGNILYIEHPDTRSYTAGFVLSLLALAPVVGVWWYWEVLRVWWIGSEWDNEELIERFERVVDMEMNVGVDDLRGEHSKSMACLGKADVVERV